MGMPIISVEPVTCENSVGNIIESIAMEERSLAHILNAESEKLHAIIGIPNITSEQIIAANQSVKSTIDTVIRLENLLLAKLALYSGAICKTK